MKCAKCEKEAIKVFRPDLDLAGIGMCEDHEDEISIHCIMLMTPEEEIQQVALEYFKDGK